MKDRKRFVELLLDSGADPNIKNRVTGMPLLHATARSGNFEVLDILLDKDNIDLSLKDNDECTIIHWLARVSERKPGDKQRVEDCLYLLQLQDYSLKVGIDDRDSSGKTALCVAVERGFQERVMKLLENYADVMAVEHGSKILLSESLSILEEIVDNVLISNDKQVTSSDLQLTWKDQLLWKIVSRMSKSQNLSQLLRHPVISTFLHLKWNKIKMSFPLHFGFLFFDRDFPDCVHSIF
jgi:hypothetical protein